MYSAIVGDFNAKNGTLNDFIIPDETLLDLFYLDSDNDVLSYMLDYEKWKIRVFHYLEFLSVAVNQITMGLNY